MINEFSKSEKAMPPNKDNSQKKEVVMCHSMRSGTDDESQIILCESSFLFGRGAVHFSAASKSAVDKFQGLNGVNIRVEWFKLCTNTQQVGFDQCWFNMV